MNINQLTALQPVDRQGYAPFGRCLECGWVNNLPETHHPECAFNDVPGTHYEVIVFNPETEVNHDSN